MPVVESVTPPDPGTPLESAAQALQAADQLRALLELTIQKLRDLTERTDQEVTRLVTRRAELLPEIERLETARAELSADLTRLTAQASDLRDRVRADSDQLDAVRGQLAKVRSALKEI